LNNSQLSSGDQQFSAEQDTDAEKMFTGLIGAGR